MKKNVLKSTTDLDEENKIWHLADMHSRPILWRYINIDYPMYDDKNLLCPDCEREANVIIHEINPNRGQPKEWAYCGYCEIGG